MKSPTQLLLTALAALTLQSINAQQMPYRGTLEHTLISEQSITTAGDIEAATLFTPEGAEMGALMKFFPFFVAGFCMIAFVMAFFLPSSMAYIGKKDKNEDESN